MIDDNQLIKIKLNTMEYIILALVVYSTLATIKLKRLRNENERLKFKNELHEKELKNIKKY